MSFRKRLLLILWTASCVVFSAAQDKTTPVKNRPDLTGVWERNQSTSTSGRGTRPPASVRLTITHKELELRVIRKTNSNGKESINEAIYYTDGRGEKNPSLFQTALVIGGLSQSDSKKPIEVKSKTKWQGDKLVSRSSTPHDVLGNRIFLEVTETRELSGDGKTLTIVTLFMPGRSIRTEVFDRVQ